MKGQKHEITGDFRIYLVLQLDSQNVPNRETVAKDVAEIGADYAYKHFRTDLTVEQKSSKIDIVTEIDQSTQQRIISAIKEQYPTDDIVGEEGDERKTIPNTGYAWIIDPIDGTQNYVRGANEWVTSVAVVKDGTPITAINTAPALSDRYRTTSDSVMRGDESVTVSNRTDLEKFVIASTLRYTENARDDVGKFMKVVVDRFGELRRIGSAQLTFSLVACGILDAVIGLDPHPNAWDTVAGVYQIRCAGGTVTDIDGNIWEPGGPGVVASNGEVHDEVLKTVEI